MPPLRGTLSMLQWGERYLLESNGRSVVRFVKVRGAALVHYPPPSSRWTANCASGAPAASPAGFCCG